MGASPSVPLPEREHADFVRFGTSVYKGEVMRWKDGRCIPDGAGIYTWHRDADWLKYKRYTTYEGEWRRFKQHGHGVYTHANGSGYVGEWDKGTRHGVGIENSVDWKGQWTTYDGYFRADQRHGCGILTNFDGHVYEGEWENGTKSGRGVERWPDGRKYDGEWLSGKRHGNGSSVFSDGWYEGEWRGGQRHGVGTCVWGDGDGDGDGRRYHGEWVDDLQGGHGRSTYANGDVYEGGYHEGKRHGRGTYWHSDGSAYEGDWFQGVEHGEGICIERDGSRYEGHHFQGKYHGHGARRGADGSSYLGAWQVGKRHGKGEEIRADGTKYVGHFVAGLPHGRGELVQLEAPISPEEKDEPAGMVLEGTDVQERFMKLAAGPTVVGKAVCEAWTLKVGLRSAAHLPKMDSFGSCDPYCTLKVGTHEFSSKIIKASYTPEWNEDFDFKIDPTHFVDPTNLDGLRLEVTVFDWDRVSKNDIVGHVEVPIAPLAMAASALQTLPLIRPDTDKAVWGHDKQPASITLFLDSSHTRTKDPPGSDEQQAQETRIWKSLPPPPPVAAAAVVSDGYVYEGEWENGTKSGRGVERWPDGRKYDGEWLSGKRHGNGSSVFSDGWYEGEWRGGQRHGVGTCVWGDGDGDGDGRRYHGEWAFDAQEGCGKCTYANGDEYDGEWSKGKRHGQGTLIEASLTKYQGEWVDDAQEGYGVMASAHDAELGRAAESYHGHWHAGRKHGEGSSSFAADGSRYDGQYAFGEPHGRGRYEWADGSAYTGEWEHGVMAGHCEFTFSNGAKYDGDYCELLAEQKRAHAFTRYDQGALLWQSQAAHDLQDLVAAVAAGLPAEGDRDHEDDAPMHE